MTCFFRIRPFVWYNTHCRGNDIKKGIKMQEIITILSGLLSIIGFYWAFLQKSNKESI